uniref:Uncharacterized protein n=1 Tax=Sphaerodactylus townsendi TaxID=933632 RepID=A0ACB8F6U8_9SAUR
MCPLSMETVKTAEGDIEANLPLLGFMGGTEQTKQIVFVPSKEPAFVTVPRNSFGEPFVLSPSVWSLVIEAEGVLLDYLVLLPSSYYEARILQLKVSEPCTYNPSPEQAGQNCLLYKYLPVEQFTFGSGEDAVCRWDNNLPKPCPKEQVAPSYPEMILCSGSDVEVQLRIAVPQPRRYVLLVEYANADPLQTIDVSVSSPQHSVQSATLAVYTCEYSFLCRGVVLDSLNRLAAFDLATQATVRLTADRAHFFLVCYKVYLVPYDQFTAWSLWEPPVSTASAHHRNICNSNSSSCVPVEGIRRSQEEVLDPAVAGFGRVKLMPPSVHMDIVAETW